MKSEVYIGPAGWSYPDWDGIVYPARKAPRFDPLVYLACYFNLIEINNTFYRVPTRRACASWASRVSNRPDFRFTVKAFREFTHGRSPAREQEVAAFKRAVEPLYTEGRLGTILVQFPWSFRSSAPAIEYIATLNAWFDPYPVSFEVRHGSWGNTSSMAVFRDHDITMCAIDQPLIGDSLTPGRFVPGRSGAYFRLHGRNRAEWFKPGTNRDRRYDYMYSPEELSRWTDRIRRAAERIGKIHVVLNNHFRGQAVANALQLKAMLLGASVPAPPTLLEAYPPLAALLKPERVAEAGGGGAAHQPSLFEKNDD